MSRFVALARTFNPRGSERRRIPRPLIPVIAFLLLTLIGWFVLLMPFSHQGGGFTPLMDALFAAVSATTTTGLTTQDVATFWSMPGQITLLLLTFFGGLGFMVLASLLLIHSGQRILSILQEDTGDTPYLGNGRRLGVRIGLVIVGVQFVGFLALLVRFSLIEPAPDAIWKALTMTILAFNNAGFTGLHGVEGWRSASNRLGGIGNVRRIGRAWRGGGYRHSGHRAEEAVGYPFTQYEDRSEYDRPDSRAKYRCDVFPWNSRTRLLSEN